MKTAPGAADIFLSYANEDRERIARLASALEQHGWCVWWDRRIIAGQTFDQVIERELETAKSVVVLWSKESIASEWVKNEAAAAADRGVLVPARIDDVKPPLEFRRKQTVDLSGWNGDPDHEGFQQLCEGIAAATKSSSKPPRTEPQRGLKLPNRYRMPLAITGIIIAVSVLGYVIWPGGDDITGSSYRVETLANEARLADNPFPLREGIIHKLTLDEDEESHFRLASPVSELKIFLDMRRPDNKVSNLQSRLSMLGKDGEVIEENIIRFNEIDVGQRITTVVFRKQPVIFGFKLLNTSAMADFWLTVFKNQTPPFVPLFGEITPAPLKLDQRATGILENDEFTYYVTELPRGDHKIILDFSTLKGANTNIQGYLAVLDPDGGNQERLIVFNEIDVSSRKVTTLSSRVDGPVIIKIHNTTDAVNYTFNITQNP